MKELTLNFLHVLYCIKRIKQKQFYITILPPVYIYDLQDNVNFLHILLIHRRFLPSKSVLLQIWTVDGCVRIFLLRYKKVAGKRKYGGLEKIFLTVI